MKKRRRRKNKKQEKNEKTNKQTNKNKKKKKTQKKNKKKQQKKKKNNNNNKKTAHPSRTCTGSYPAPSPDPTTPRRGGSYIDAQELLLQHIFLGCNCIYKHVAETKTMCWAF